MPSFGDKLRLEREKRKITLEEISASTKIGTRMLLALEGDKFGQLPGGIFNKGFVRAYARVVGLDEDQAVADYLQASGDASPAAPETRDNARETNARETEERISRLETISDSPSRPLPWGIFALILLAVALALSLWSHRRREQERLAAHTPSAKAALQSSAAPSRQGDATSSTGGSAIQPLPVTTPMTSATVPATTSSEKTSSPVGQNSPSGTRTAATPAALTPEPGEFTVVIQAREQSWISIIVDGKPTPSALLEAGSERTIRARKQVVVKAGNAGGVDFRLDGKKLDVGGDFGEVRIVTIGPAGLVASATPPPAP